MLHTYAIWIEVVELVGLLLLLCYWWRRIGPISKVVGPYCIVALAVDIIIFKCERPYILQEIFNLGNVLLAFLVLYENLKQYLKALAVDVLSLFM